MKNNDRDLRSLCPKMLPSNTEILDFFFVIHHRECSITERVDRQEL